ncbi:MAG TPA: hypothetical protein VKY85_27100 [Candidatus Angelobacter sp.]|nr:hypothetical protein [Candidatus Angelobacter sp.]
MREYLLRLYSFITNYRFRKIIKRALSHRSDQAVAKELDNQKVLLPTYYQNLTTEEIRTKATASLTSVSAFLGFSVALLPLIAWREFDALFTLSSKESRWYTALWTMAAFLLPYLSFWIERHISVASVEGGKKEERDRKRRFRSAALLVLLALSVCLFIGIPWWFPAWNITFKHSFLLAGTVMIVLSVAFFLFALEFYDSAAGWRGKEGLHFHLAGIASNSFIFGVSLALTGSALMVCALDFVVGRVLAIGTLLVLVAMTEIERALWDLEREYENPSTPAGSAL